MNNLVDHLDEWRIHNAIINLEEYRIEAGYNTDLAENFAIAIECMEYVAGIKREREAKKPKHPCVNCGTGWGAISSTGIETCHDTCQRLAKYNKENSDAD